MNERPLNIDELSQLVDLYVTADHDGNFYIDGSDIDEACKNMDMTAIFDAESELICIAPRDKADALARLFNSYQHSGERNT